MNKPVWKVGDRVTLRDGDGSVAVVVSTDPVIRYTYPDDEDRLEYYANPDDLLEAPEEKRCCETCKHSTPIEGSPQFYECLAPLPDCVNATMLMLPHMGETCPVWGPRV